MQAVPDGNVLAVLPPRHLAPLAPLPKDEFVMHVIENSCQRLPFSPDYNDMKARAPVGLQTANGAVFATYMAECIKTRLPEWKQPNVFCIYGRTEDGASVVVVVPCPISFYVELPRSLDGTNTISTANVQEIMQVLQTQLDAEVDMEMMDEANAWKFRNGRPSVDFKYEFCWRSRTSGCKLDSDGNIMKHPMVRITASNQWIERRVVAMLRSDAMRLPGMAKPLRVQLWELSSDVKPDTRFLLENDIPSAGWVRITGYRNAGWQMSHCDHVAIINGPKSIARMPDKLTAAPVGLFSVDIEAINSGKEEYLKMIGRNRTRLPRVWDPSVPGLTDNNITVIGMVYQRPDGSEARVALQWDTTPNERQMRWCREEFTTQGRTFEYVRVTVPNEQAMICALRDIIVHYDPDGIVDFNGDTFDWPYLMGRMGEHKAGDKLGRVYASGRLIWTEWRTQYVQCTNINGRRVPTFGKAKTKNKKKKKNSGSKKQGDAFGVSIPVWELGRYKEATLCPVMSGRFSCDVRVLIVGLSKYDGRFVCQVNSLDEMCGKFLKNFRKMKVDLFGNWHGVSKFNPQDSPEDQRRTLVNYCVIDCVCPLMLINELKLMNYVLQVSSITSARAHDVINKGQLPKTSALYAAEAWRDGAILAYSMREAAYYEGAIVLPPKPFTLAGIPDEDLDNAQVLEDQTDLPDGYDWNLFINDDLPSVCDQCGKPHAGHKFGTPDAKTYDAKRKCVQVSLTLTCCGTATTHCVWVPAVYKNNNLVVTLDFKSLYPSIISTFNLCSTTLVDPAEPLNAAETFAQEALAWRRAADEHTDPAAIRVAAEAHLANMKQQHTNSTYDFVDDTTPMYVDDVDDDDHDDDDHDDDDDNNHTGGDDNEPEATNCYIPGDGDRTGEMSDGDRFFTIQASNPDNRKYKRVHKFVKHEILRSILARICERCLNERERMKKLIKELQKVRNTLVMPTAERIAEARAIIACGSSTEHMDLVTKALVHALREVNGGSPADLHAAMMQHHEVITLLLRLEMYDSLQLVFKIIANSVYGSAGNKLPRHFLASPAAAESVTAVARQTIIKSRAAVLGHFREKYPDKVIDVVYGDTDSIFVWIKVACEDDGWALAKEMCDYINTVVFGHYKHSKFQIQFEALKRDLTQFKKKTYVAKQIVHGRTYWELLQKGVATVRRDRPEVLTDMLSEIFTAITTLGNYRRLVVVTFIMRIVWEHLERMVANKTPVEKYAITQRIMSMPRAGVKPSQQFRVAEQSSKQDGVPVRLGDSVTYVLTHGNNAIALLDAKLKEVDRLTYLQNRMSAYLLSVLVPFVGKNKVELVRILYEPPMSSTMSLTRTTPEQRWAEIMKMVVADRKTAFYTAKTQQQQTRKRRHAQEEQSMKKQTSLLDFVKKK